MTDVPSKKYTNKFNKLSEWIEHYNDISIQYQDMLDVVKQHSEYKEFTIQKQKHSQSIIDIKNQKESLKTQIKSYKQNLKNLKNDYNDIQYTIYTAHNLYNQYLQLSLNNWYDELSILKQLIIEFEDYDSYIQNDKPLYDKYNSCLKEYQEYQEYITQKEHLENIIDSHYLVNTINHNIDIYEKYNYLKKALELSNSHNDREKLLEKLEQAEENYKQLIIDHSKLSVNLKQQQDISKILQELQSFKTDIDNKRETIIIIKDYSNKYQEWLYSQHILPNIINMANSLIARATHQDSQNIIISYNIHNEGIEWMINTSDRNNKDNNGLKLSVNKASGFQKFITSIALRIVIPKLQSKYYKCNQLFLDEGWTSADSNNRSIVPTFLRTLLHEFESVILVSHIDEIRDNVDYKIDIIKDDSNHSHISFQ